MPKILNFSALFFSFKITALIFSRIKMGNILASFLTVLIVLLIYPVSALAQPFAYVANENTDDVSVIDTATNMVVATIPVGVDPRNLAITPDGTRVYVSDINIDNVSVIDTVTNMVVGPPIPVGESPFGIAITPVLLPPPPPLRAQVPTLSEWGLIAMACILGLIGVMVIRRRKAAA